MTLQPSVFPGQAPALPRELDEVGVLGPVIGRALAVEDGSAVSCPEQVRRRLDFRPQVVPADLPRLSERQPPTALLQSHQVQMGDPAELCYPGGHDHAAHGFALAALLEDAQPLTDEREPMP